MVNGQPRQQTAQFGLMGAASALDGMVPLVAAPALSALVRDLRVSGRRFPKTILHICGSESSRTVVLPKRLMFRAGIGKYKWRSGKQCRDGSTGHGKCVPLFGRSNAVENF